MQLKLRHVSRLFLCTCHPRPLWCAGGDGGCVGQRCIRHHLQGPLAGSRGEIEHELQPHATGLQHTYYTHAAYGTPAEYQVMYTS